jgi:DNA-binding YbaB/EbfC family protein
MSKPDLQRLMAMAQKMQESMQNMQKGLGDKKITGSAGTGDIKVEVVMNGETYVEKVVYGVEAYNEGREILADLTVAAFNNAIDKVKALTKDALMDIYNKYGSLDDQTGE